jgi:glycosyltransferase involved in cell wall biosynthesis
MNKKIKILIANDSSILGTGYGVYAKELLTRLHKKGDYDIAELACYVNCKNTEIQNIPWKVYPNAPDDPNSDESKHYNSKPVNQFGLWRFNKVLSHYKPDIVFDVRDYWMYAFQEVSPYRRWFKWVVMPTVDSAPQKLEWLDTFASADLIVPYTEWSQQTLINQCGDKINLFPKIANAGVDLDKFRPVKSKSEIQKELYGRQLSVTGCVMRNQKRKLFFDLFSAYRLYLNQLISDGKKELYENSYLHVHTSYPEVLGWQLGELLLETKMLDKTLFTYTCRHCKQVQISKFHQSLAKCKHCGNISSFMPNASNPVSTEDLVKIYNCFNLFIQYAICEGFGMPQIEAAACGIPIASVDYSAMTEIVTKLNGYHIPVQRMFREMETGADRAYPNNNSVKDILYDFFIAKTEDQRNNFSAETRKLCKRYYSWDSVAAVWDEALKSIDISTNLDWDKPDPQPCDTSIKVPQNLNQIEYIKFIVDNIINEPYLWNVSPIKQLTRSFCLGLVALNGGIRTMDHAAVTQMLETFLNNKQACENMRLNGKFEELFYNVKR